MILLLFNKFTCPGCNINYIGKTERNLNERTTEHASSDKTGAIKTHIDNSESINHINSSIFF